MIGIRKRKEAVVEPTLLLYLEDSGSCIDLKGVDKEGLVWSILYFDKNKGTFKRLQCLPAYLGLTVDLAGSIVENKT